MQQALADGGGAWLLGLVLDAEQDLRQVVTPAPDLMPAWHVAPTPVDDRGDALLATRPQTAVRARGMGVACLDQGRGITED